MNNTKILFDNAWLLLLVIPVVVLAFIPFLRLNKQSRRSKNRIPSLIIHIVILVMVTLVFSGMKIQKENVINDENTLLLVDTSDSSINSKNKIDKYIENVLKNYNYDKNVGIIVFGNECEYVAKLNSNASKVYDDYKKYKSDELRKDATNIEDALYYAKNILGEDGGRVIVLTDGIETDGDALITASRLINENIQIDAVYFDNDPINDEVQINSININEPVSLGKDVKIDIEVASKTNCVIKVKLYDNDILINEQDVFIKDNFMNVSFIHQFDKGGEHTLKAVVETEKDTYVENNQYYSFINILDDTRILIVDGTGSESSKLYNLIKDDYEIVRTQASSVSTDINELSKYSEIILMNASMKTLPNNFDDVLKNYVELGGNVLTTGGQNTYYYGDMIGSKFEDILPVEIEKGASEPISVMLVIDASGSMDDTWSGASQKIDIAIQAAKESVNALSDKDYVGVIAFNSTANVIVPMTPCSQRSSIIKKIEGIKTATGTYYGPALEAAGKELIPFNKTEIKHIIFTSDGEPVDGNTRYFDLVSSMYESGITTSSVAIDPSFDSDILKRVATFGGGNFHSVVDASKLDDIMIEEVNSLQGEYFNEGEFTPRINRYTSSVQGVNSLPDITGYVGSSSKPKSTIVLKANNDPLYAQWKYEKGNISGGKVGSFMSDLSGNWTKEFMEDERGIKFIKNVITDLLSSEKVRTDMNVRFLRDNFKNIIEVKTPAVTGLGTVKATITYPNNETKTIDLKLTASNTYSAEIPDYGSEGLYKVDIVKAVGSRETIEYSFTVFSYSMEYNAFYDNQENYEFVNKLCQNSKGVVYSLDDNIFSNEVMLKTKIINPQVLLLLVSLFLFLIDIIVRKFNFKWLYDKLSRRKKGEE